MARSWKKSDLIKYARLHYEQGLSARQIAELPDIRVSRATVDRMLRDARCQGVFHLRVVTDSSETQLLQLKSDLKKRYPHLVDVRIVAGSDKCHDAEAGKYHTDTVLAGVALAGSRALAAALNDKQVIAVGAGELVKATVNAVRVPKSLDKLRIVPMTGYLTPHYAESSSNLTAHLLQSKVGGTFYWLPVVGVVEETARSAVENLPVVSEALKVMKETTVVLTSIGPIDRTYVRGFRRTQAFLGKERIKAYVDQVKANRPVGVFGAWQFDKEGEPVKPILSVIGLDLADMRRVVRDGGRVIAVVGAANAERLIATHAALTGGYCNVLVTDHCTARALLERKSAVKAPSLPST